MTEAAAPDPPPDRPRSDARRSADALTRIAAGLEDLTRRREPRVGNSNADLRQFRFADFARGQLLHGIMGAFDREVPSEYWSLDTRDSFPVALPVALVSCPCGETPEAVAGVAVSCDCGRAFLFTGKAVKVAFSPAEANRPTPVPS